MITYSWRFSQLKVAQSQGELSNVAHSIDYRLCRSDDNGNAYHYGTLEFAPADPENFVPFEQLTEADMIAFAEATLGAELDTIKTTLGELTANPITEMPLPWVETVEPDFLVPYLN